MVIRLKGRSPWNKTSNRKADVYKLLIQVGGEARWKTLKAHLQELGLGPTTLKQTLDEMVTERSITKEARLGGGGAEVWYKIQVKDNYFWEQFANAIDDGVAYSLQEANGKDMVSKKWRDPLPDLFKNIREQATKLEGDEKAAYLLAQMQKIVKMASEEYLTFLYLYVRGCQTDNADIMKQVFEYYVSDLLIQQTKAYQEFLSDYSKVSLRAITDYLKTSKNEP